MDNNLQKFKSLVEIAKVEYQDELNRNSRLEEKVGKFLMGKRPLNPMPIF